MRVFPVAPILLFTRAHGSGTSRTSKYCSDNALPKSFIFSTLHDDDDAGWCHHIVTDNGGAYLSCYSLRKEKRSNNNKLYLLLFIF